MHAMRERRGQDTFVFVFSYNTFVTVFKRQANSSEKAAFFFMDFSLSHTFSL